MGCNDIEIRKSESVAKSQFLYSKTRSSVHIKMLQYLAIRNYFCEGYGQRKFVNKFKISFLQYTVYTPEPKILNSINPEFPLWGLNIYVDFDFRNLKNGEYEETSKIIFCYVQKYWFLQTA